VRKVIYRYLASNSETLRLGEIVVSPIMDLLVLNARSILASLPARASWWQAGFSQERMTCVPEESKVIYQSKDGRAQKVFDALRGKAHPEDSSC